jgi:hypothetical protein
MGLFDKPGWPFFLTMTSRLSSENQPWAKFKKKKNKGEKRKKGKKKV